MSLTVWVCGACGKVAESRSGLRDSSCITWAVECWRSSVIWRAGMGNVATRAVTADTTWVEPAEPPPPRYVTEHQVQARARRLAARAARRDPR